MGEGHHSPAAHDGPAVVGQYLPEDVKGDRFGEVIGEIDHQRFSHPHRQGRARDRRGTYSVIEEIKPPGRNHGAIRHGYGGLIRTKVIHGSPGNSRQGCQEQQDHKNVR